VQRVSFAYAKLKHMRDRAAQKEQLAQANAGRSNSVDWIWSYDPVGGWDQEPRVPTIS